MAMTSFFDRPETGSGVIIMVLIFSGLPAMFASVGSCGSLDG